MKRSVYKTAFSWLSEIRAADNHGTKAAAAFAAAVRVETRKNTLEAGFPVLNAPPRVVCGDSMFDQWIIEASFEGLISKYLNDCTEHEADAKPLLDAAAEMLERMAVKARKLSARAQSSA